ncbi:C1 family peptidase [Cystobacter fuscus]|uniref:C1 family peptidase n=1 Tax=Cystobacter fuscus TaxID=43 RepID=UPI0037C09D38
MMRLKVLSAVLGFLCTGCVSLHPSRDDGHVQSGNAIKPPEFAFDQSLCRKQCAAERMMSDDNYCGTDKKTYTACAWECGDVPPGISVWPEACQADGSPAPGSPAEPADGDLVCGYMRVNDDWVATSCSEDLVDMVEARSAAGAPAVHWREVSSLRVFPNGVDHRPGLGPIKKQGDAATCTAFATVAAIESALRAKGHKYPLSEMHLWARYHQPYTHMALTAASKGGLVADYIAKQNGFGYDPKLATAWEKGPVELDANSSATLARLDKLSRFRVESIEAITPPANLRHPTTDQLATALAQGRDIVVSVYMSSGIWEHVGENGIIPEYNLDARNGHAMLAVGYMWIHGIRYFILRNSWGDRQGNAGYFYMSELTLNANMLDGAPCFSVQVQAEVFAPASAP